MIDEWTNENEIDSKKVFATAPSFLQLFHKNVYLAFLRPSVNESHVTYQHLLLRTSF